MLFKEGQFSGAILIGEPGTGCDEGRAKAWENYLADPKAAPDPENARTQICWPVD